MFRLMQFVPLFLLISGGLVAYAAEHPTASTHVVLILLAWRFLSR